MPRVTRVAVLQEKALVSLSWVLLWQKCKTIQSCGWHEYECQPRWSWIRDPRLSVLSTWFYSSYSCPFRLDRQTNTTTTTTNSLEDEAGRGLREFKGGLGHKRRPCLKKNQNQKETKTKPYVGSEEIVGTYSLGRTSRLTHRYTLAPRNILPLFKSVLVAERPLRARECFHDPSSPVVGTFSCENHTFYLRLESPHYNATFLPFENTE